MFYYYILFLQDVTERERERERERMHARQAYDQYYVTCNDKQWYSISSLENHSKHTHTHKFHFLNPDVMIEKFSIILGQCLMHISGLSFIINIQGYYKRNRHFQRYVVSKPLA